MSEREFCYWLQGYIELTNKDRGLTIKQVAIIKEHLGLVFDKVTNYTLSQPFIPNDVPYC